MINFNNYVGNELKVIKPSFWKSEFFLIDGQNALGSLKSLKVFNDLYSCQINDNEFEFYKKNLFSSEILIKEKHKELPFAKFKANIFFTSGELNLDRGRRLSAKISTFKNNLIFYESQSNIIIKLNCKISLKENCIIRIEKKSELLNEFPWIPLFGFYLIKASYDTGTVFH